MQVVAMVLVFMLAVIVSTYVARLLPGKVPLPLLQIALGAILGSFFGFDVPLDPHLFFLLFIPPLLFLDGWRIPKGALLRDLRPIVLLATGLVVFTIVGMGYLLHWMLPVIPLAAAFALAAILSPTDPVAVSAMTAGSSIPSRLMHILEGESLLNDASGLVSFNFAVAAVVTGGFSLGTASLSFIWVAGGGIVVGLLITWLIGRCNRLLVNRVGEDPATQILISLLIPFAAYMLAESLEVSGILAAVAAGITMHYGELSGRALPATRMQRHAVWDTMQITFNGIIFVLLGDQLPRILQTLPEVIDASGITRLWHLPVMLAAVTLSLVLLRFVWVWASMHMTLRLGTAETRVSTRLLALMSVAGVRGSVTLAGILTLPLLMPDGSNFPARTVLIFFAMGVVLLSLLLAWLALPLLARNLGDLPQRKVGKSIAVARIVTGEAALHYLEGLAEKEIDGEDPTRAELLANMIEFYRRQIEDGGAEPEESGRTKAMQRQLRLQALAVERRELLRLRRESGIDDDVHQSLQHEIDLLEVRLGKA